MSNINNYINKNLLNFIYYLCKNLFYIENFIKFSDSACLFQY